MTAGAPLRVLLVEDNDDDAALLGESLKYTGFAIERADKLMAAIDRLESAYFDIVLLDLHLPDSQGFDTFQRLHMSAPGVAIIVLTGLDDEELGLKTVQEGAQDYLVKGDAGKALLIRAIRYAVERKRAEEITLRFAEELRARNAELEDDLRLAREIQEGFLPRRYPKFPANGRGAGALRFDHRYAPAGEVGGDFFDVTAIAPDLAGILICDVMGHGVRAALVTAMLRAMLGERPPAAKDPRALLDELNRRLRAILKTADAPMFVSAFYLTVQATTGELSWASAGHPSPVLISQRRHLAELLQPTPDFSGRVLGLFDDPVFPTGKRILERGDRVVCFTDGIYEVDGARGESFGLGRLRKAFEARVGVPADRLLDEVIGEVQRYSGSGGFDDDACLLSIDFVQEDQPDDRRRAGASAEPEGAR